MSKKQIKEIKKKNEARTATMEEYKNKVIDEQLKKIREIAPDLAIIET